MSRVKSYIIAIVLTVLAVAVPITLYGYGTAAAQGDDVMVMATVPHSDEGPGVMIVSPVEGTITNVSMMNVEILLEGATSARLYKNGQVVCERTAITQPIYVMNCLVDLYEGKFYHDKKVVAKRYDWGHTTTSTASVLVRFDRGWLPPNTGFLRIGGVSIAREDYIASCVVIVMVLVGAIGFWLTRREKEEEEKKMVAVRQRRSRRF